MPPNVAGRFVVEDRERHTFRVDRRAYALPDVFERERAQIFRRCWLYAAHASELPRFNDFITREVGGKPLILTRGQDGTIRALVNTCPHRGSRVCAEPRGSARVFTCPYHSWTFDTTGALRGLPGRDAYACNVSDMNLEPVRLESYRDFLFVNFDENAGSLVEYLAGATEQIDLIVDQSLGKGMEVVPGTQQYGARANWKLLAENSIDTYHVMALHRRYVDYVVKQGVTPVRPTGRALDLGNGHAVSETSPPISCKPVAWWGPPMPESRVADIENLRVKVVDHYGEARAFQIYGTYRQLLIFPNLMLIDTCATTIRTWTPRDHGSMDVTAWALCPRDQAPEDRAAALHSFLLFFGPGGFATPDDIEMLEQCQRHFATDETRFTDCSRGMTREAPAYDDDLPLRAFWRRWQQLMEAP